MHILRQGYSFCVGYLWSKNWSVLCWVFLWQTEPHSPNPAAGAVPGNTTVSWNFPNACPAHPTAHPGLSGVLAALWGQWEGSLLQTVSSLQFVRHSLTTRAPSQTSDTVSSGVRETGLLWSKNGWISCRNEGSHTGAYCSYFFTEIWAKNLPFPVTFTTLSRKKSARNCTALY